MKKLFKNKVLSSLLAIVVVLSIFFGVLNAVRTKSTWAENICRIVFTPVQEGAYKLSSSVSSFFGSFGDKDKLQEEIEKLKQENSILKQQVDKNNLFKTENEELRRILTLKNAYPELEYQAAEVVGRNPSEWLSIMTIDKGTAAGIDVNDVVVSADKMLVGKITDVGSNWAKVTLVTDPSNSIGSMILRSGEMGVISGERLSDGSSVCKLLYLSKNADIVVGDSVETSGLGGVYPKGITIGRVTEIKADLQSISQYAVVETGADIENIKKVLVVTNDFSVVETVEPEITEE
ncbi:MAG: rod shape-determining protein MreC [Clostridia bacterium]|nr:rod shape-determining protein MreC [Clostridia bacterium]